MSKASIIRRFKDAATVTIESAELYGKPWDVHGNVGKPRNVAKVTATGIYYEGVHCAQTRFDKGTEWSEEGDLIISTTKQITVRYRTTGEPSTEPETQA